MPSFFTGTTTQGTTGNKSITGVGFQPAYLRFTVSSKSTAETTVAHFSQGFTDGTRQKAHSIIADSTGFASKAYSDRCINHYERVAGVLTEIIKATFVSFDADGFTLNFVNASSNYSIYIEAFA